MQHPTEIPLSGYPDADAGMPEVNEPWWDHQTADGRPLIHFKPGQQVRIAYPSQCTFCRNPDGVVPEFVGLVAVKSERANGGHGVTVWNTLCPKHSPSRAALGRA